MLWIPQRRFYYEEISSSVTWYKPKRFPCILAYILLTGGGRGGAAGSTGAAGAGGVGGRTREYFALLRDNSYSISIGAGSVNSVTDAGSTTFGSMSSNDLASKQYAVDNGSYSGSYVIGAMSGYGTYGNGGTSGANGASISALSSIFGIMVNSGGTGGGANGGGGGGASYFGVGGTGGTYPGGNGTDGTKGAGGGGGARTTVGSSTQGVGGDGYCVIMYWLPDF